MANGMKVDDVPQAALMTEKPVTDVTKNTKKSRAELDFNMTIIIIGAAWVLLFALIYSLRRYNI